ncbi:non-functional NADPH-dependent codeinone reductase 2-like isoform X2 [Tasmannia lanceolata]|uniref:non-functional NADPH-dependent codeinone reductase 2-like isoform X2 n=1 Tax=Tasmannia lanceolata TaxID=3420 RepID=UPI004063FB0D
MLVISGLYKEWVCQNQLHKRKMGSIPKVILSSGSATMPCIGLGTAVNPSPGSEAKKEAILGAIQLGYRHFDTASLYNSEQPLGEAIAEALRRGLIQSRQELFITSKLWCSDAHPHLVLPALQLTLRNLQLEYIDLYLIHWPLSYKPGEFKIPPNKEDLLPMDFKSTWEAMEECHTLGLAKSVGVSNFSCKKLDLLLSTAKIPPALNQGIHVTAYAPLGAKGTPWGSNRVMECEILKKIAEAKGKTVAQVSLRWVFEQGASLVVKSFNEGRMKENLQIFDWGFSVEELDLMGSVPQGKVNDGERFVSLKGPYKSLEELWAARSDRIGFRSGCEMLFFYLFFSFFWVQAYRVSLF